MSPSRPSKTIIAKSLSLDLRGLLSTYALSGDLVDIEQQSITQRFGDEGWVVDYVLGWRLVVAWSLAHYSIGGMTDSTEWHLPFVEARSNPSTNASSLANPKAVPGHVLPFQDVRYSRLSINSNFDLSPLKAL
ncbi:uncharacterized protein EI90DRAFT_3014222 [Cantharellus anzutake]|uniref:uncharacterized protein n=1 Tax=Cantharellus anzutake TaxID=1750568 RepID=UPI0019058417|nr:uncharacterized protein EI90DRAFT_3014222 [Cantharellus anzutake]KAF8336488.1 hypothetical protein EI90DRAFT_3014222 [Cantharellus anzutake]